MLATNQFLVRVLIAKVSDVDRTISLLRSVVIEDENPEWNCVIWVRSALEILDVDKKALGIRKMSWNVIRDTALKDVQDKESQHRFDGKGKFDLEKAATFDLLDQRESVP